MAGCFGNHPFDREMENQLNRHLDEESAYERFSEKIWENCYKIDEVLTDSSDFDIFWNSDVVQNILSSCYYGNPEDPNIANDIIVRFVESAKSID